MCRLPFLCAPRSVHNTNFACGSPSQRLAQFVDHLESIPDPPFAPPPPTYWPAWRRLFQPPEPEPDSDVAAPPDPPEAAGSAVESINVHPPYVSVLVRLGPNDVLRWIRRFTAALSADPPTVQWTTASASWLYAMLARLEKPLDPEAGSLLRRLVRNCAKERSACEKVLQEGVAAAESVRERVASLSVLCVILGQYFGQAGSEEMKPMPRLCDPVGARGQ